MATWQFDFHLVPSAAIRGGTSLITEIAKSELKDFTVAWKGFSMVNDLILAFSRLLPKSDSWSSNMDTWGRTDGHRIEVFWEQADIADIRVRVDMNSYPELFMKNFIPVALQFDLIMLDAQCHILRPNEQEVVTSMRRSDAYRFVHDTTAYFEDLHQKEKNGAN